ncbi:MAG: YIP1 family protein, partial [Syntrophomonas sp.]|nr:YIP1 family protein [Syntrophomonas sp.]
MEETRMSVAERVLKVVTSPGQAFNAIAADPRILWPGLIFIVINLLLTAIILPETKAFTQETLAASGQSPDQIALAMKFITPGALVGTIIALPAVWLVAAGLLALYNQLVVGAATFKQLFAVAIFAGIPSLIQSFISTALVKMVGFKAFMQVNTSLALLWVNGDASSFLYRLLQQFELFRIWGFILLILG